VILLNDGGVTPVVLTRIGPRGREVLTLESASCEHLVRCEAEQAEKAEMAEMENLPF
jgi:hypothetical protein